MQVAVLCTVGEFLDDVLLLTVTLVSNDNVPLTRYDEQGNLCDTFHPIHSQCTKNFVDLQKQDTFYMWNNTSHLGSHRVLPTGRSLSRIPETFEFELSGCHVAFSSHSPWCFL